MVIEVKTEVKIDEDGNEYLAQVIEAPADGEEAKIPKFNPADF